ncbi:MAG: 2-oxoacid:acceptor oxidoreductase family protein [Deltaproteobacteria bacterium]|nr:MAG: 2-oxoacid:acceptor oxidoreductase family protein [Deltaproteobacteria bacterium]
MIKQQIVISGVGGQGVLFITRLLAEVALELTAPVLSSETHGMAQRGGTVISHLKVGLFYSPQIRTGQADVMLALREENVLLHGHFLRDQGLLVVNKADSHDPGAIDATGLARELGSVVSANIVLLGFALASGKLFCDVDSIRTVLARILHGQRLELSIKALELGVQAPK